MSIVDNLFDRHVQENMHCAESERHHLAVQQCKELLTLARDLEAYCEEMYTALGPQSWARQGYEKFRQARTR